MTNHATNIDFVVIGLGPVGLATILELLPHANIINGYDISEKRILNLHSRKYDFPEDGKNQIDHYLNNGKINFLSGDIQKPNPARKSFYYICVGTPTINQEIDLTQIHQTLQNLIKILKPSDHIILRSTLQPGSIQDILKKYPIRDYHFTYYPEFLREKYILDDIRNPPLKISSHNKNEALADFLTIHSQTISSVNQFTEVEMIKVASNIFHSLKVTFANEILRLSKIHKFDAHFVMDQIKSDKKLNISELYLSPGQPFAGHCLEKDLIAFLTHTKSISLPVISSILLSNNQHKDFLNNETS